VPLSGDFDFCCFSVLCLTSATEKKTREEASRKMRAGVTRAFKNGCDGTPQQFKYSLGLIAIYLVALALKTTTWRESITSILPDRRIGGEERERERSYSCSGREVLVVPKNRIVSCASKSEKGKESPPSPLITTDPNQHSSHMLTNTNPTSNTTATIATDNSMNAKPDSLAIEAKQVRRKGEANPSKNGSVSISYD